MAETFSKVAKVGVLWGFAQKFVTQFSDLIAGVVLARLLTPTDFGIAAATGFFLRFASKIANFGLGGALLRLKEMRPEHVSTVFVVNLVMGVVSWLCLTLTAPVLASIFRAPEVEPALRVAAIVYLILPFGTGQNATISRELRFRDAAIIDWVFSATLLVVSIPLAWLGFKFWSLVYAQLAANIVQVCAKIYFGGRQPRLQYSWQAFRETIPFGAGLYTKRLLNFAAEYLDSLIVGRILGMGALGLYDKAFNTVDRVTERLNPPIGFLRIFSRIQDDPDRFRRAYLKVSLVSTLIGFPVLATLIVIAPQLIEVLYGPAWRSTVLPFQILCVAGACRVSLAYASSATQAVGQIWSETWRLAVYVLFLLIGILTFAQWGIAGVATGVVAATICMMVLMQTLVSRITGLRWSELLTAQFPGIAVAAAIAGVLLAVESIAYTVAPGVRPWQLLLVQCLVACVAAGWLGFFGPFRAVRQIAMETVDEFVPGVAVYLKRFSRADAPASVTPAGCP